MDRLTAELLYQHLQGIAAQLHNIEAEQVQAYILVTVTKDGRAHLSTNITDEGQIRTVLARQALDRRPMVPTVPDLFPG